MSLKEMFHTFMDEYATVQTLEISKQNAIKDLIKHEIPPFLKSVVTSEIYFIKGSYGQGNWAKVPWIGVFDTRIAHGAQEGVYIVYLLNKDTKTLYLTLNQGTSALHHRTTELKRRADLIRQTVKEPNESLYQPINTGNKSYDSGCIFSKAYSINNLPEDDILFSDLSYFIKIYQKYYEAKTESDPNPNPDPAQSNDLMNNTPKEALQRIRSYISSKGFSYDKELIGNFYLSLKSKPFVILAGTSGTGKTRLVKLFAEAIDAKYYLIPVRPDWSDGSDLFGHFDLNGKFVDGPICECFKFAQNNPTKPVFICLDEMNLARVEYYFSDFLSVIESREKKSDGTIVTEKIARYENGIPENIYIIGTVNMDETTFPFSKKVLDRANTIEFSNVDLLPNFDTINEPIENVVINNDFLRSTYLVLSLDCTDEKKYVHSVCEKLKELNLILQKANAHIGYRVRDEIVFYMLNNKNAEYLLDEDKAFDNEIMQKILPRIQGSAAAIKDMLIELFEYCRDNNSELNTTGNNIGKQMTDLASSAKYPASAAKIGYMMTRYEEDGFTSYWL